MTVNVPEGLAVRLAAEANRRGIAVDAVAAELLAAGLADDDRLQRAEAIDAAVAEHQRRVEDGRVKEDAVDRGEFRRRYGS